MNWKFWNRKPQHDFGHYTPDSECPDCQALWDGLIIAVKSYFDSHETAGTEQELGMLVELGHKATTYLEARKRGIPVSEMESEVHTMTMEGELRKEDLEDIHRYIRSKLRNVTKDERSVDVPGNFPKPPAGTKAGNA